MATTVKGLSRLKRQLLQIPQSIKGPIRKALADSAEGMVGEMKFRAPVDEGDLRESIGWRFGDQAKVKYSQEFGARAGHELSVVVYAGNSKVRYAHLVEFGAAPHVAGGQFQGAQHPGAPAKPFFFPTVRARKKAIKSKISRAANAAVKAAAKR